MRRGDHIQILVSSGRNFDDNEIDTNTYRSTSKLLYNFRHYNSYNMAGLVIRVGSYFLTQAMPTIASEKTLLVPSVRLFKTAGYMSWWQS